MNLKKISSILASCVVAGALFTGCGGGTSSAPPEDIKIGMIRHLNVTENLMDDLIQKAGEKAGIKLTTHTTTFYDNLNMLQMGLESGSVQEASVYKCVADYLIARAPNYEVVENHNPMKLADNFAFAMRADNTELKAEIDAALTNMRNEGVLDQLAKTYITDLQGAEDPPAVAIENIPGAESLKVAVTGDLPPLDLVLANGQVAGFNTAMLAEISKRLNKNIEIVQIESGARAAALSSNQVDVVFWAIIPVSEDMPMDIDKPEGVELSAPYFKDDIVHIQLKK